MKTKFLILLTAIFIMQIYLVSALTIGSVTSNPAEVQPGEEFTLGLKIENNLNQDVKDVVVSLVLNTASNTIPFAPYQSSNEVRIDKIKSDDDEKATFDLTAFSDAVSGTYMIPVTVSYVLNNSGNATTESLGLVSVIINAKPRMDISLEDSVLIKGTRSNLKIRIVNSGLGDAKFLSITLGQSSRIQITGSDKVYIGNIDSNDFDTADFNIFVNANAPSSISLPVEITYSDSGNNQITETETLLAGTYTQKEAIDMGLVSKNNTFLIIISVAGALVLFLVYRRIRKRIKNKRNG
ncbi:MAG: hypothetical protein PHH00_02390 [Candidatus Nanoarchaeia archaeon]|nr:hypothetical protein [Candidatus Nanoarchaeia archaeon]